jgi:hypothetical protein
MSGYADRLSPVARTASCITDLIAEASGGVSVDRYLAIYAQVWTIVKHAGEGMPIETFSIVPDQVHADAYFTVIVQASPGAKRHFAWTATGSLMLTLKDSAETWARVVRQEMGICQEFAAEPKEPQ